MRRRRHTADAIDRVIYGNPARFLGQCPAIQPVVKSSIPTPHAP
jgi:hypothetical protein